MVTFTITLVWLKIMTLSLDIELDSSWDEYKDMPVELLMEDLFSGYLEKDGIKNVTVTNVKI